MVRSQLDYVLTVQFPAPPAPPLATKTANLAILAISTTLTTTNVLAPAPAATMPTAANHFAYRAQGAQLVEPRLPIA
jgi:hypothetical protein